MDAFFDAQNSDYLSTRPDTVLVRAGIRVRG